MPFDIVGKSLPGVDAYDKVRGGYSYPVEQQISGMLFGKILRSNLPHARIKSIDTSKAERSRGVKVVVTWKDFPRIYYHPKIGVDPDSVSMVKDFLVMDDMVRYVGDEVAAVAAISEEAALNALDLIEVDYEELPFARDMIQANKLPPLHPSVGKVAFKMNKGWGDVYSELKTSDYIFENSYSTQRVSQFPLESHVCLCDIDRDGNLVVLSSTQMIHGLRERLGTVLNYPISKIRVVKPRYIGGAFGAKLDMNPMEPITVMLALKSRKPVRIRLTREEEILTTVFMPTEQRIKTGVGKDGRILSQYCDMVADCGAHSSHAPSILVVAASGFLSSYKAKGALFEGSAVYTNNPPAGAYRGYGGPQALYGIEQQIDQIAKELKIDPIEFRLRNSWREGDPNPRFGGDIKIVSYAFEDCLLKGREAFEKMNSRPAYLASSGKIKGRGLACIPMGGSGITGKKGGSIEASGALIKLNVDGTLDLIVATIDQGGGQNTILTQIAAEAVGALFKDVRLSQVDTDTSPIDAPTHATRVTYVVGSVVEKAANQLRMKILDAASEILGVPANELVASGSIVRSRVDANKFVTFDQIGKKTVYAAPGGQLVGESTEIPHSNPTPSGAHFAEVEIDPETGKIIVTRYLAVHDVGKAINPLGIEGQVIGGIMQGIGYALTEQVYFDENGIPSGTDLADYKILGTLDMPDMKVLLVEKPDPTGPFGAKGVSEPAIIPVAPAIANAVADAIGLRITSLPITCESVLAALEAKRKQPNVIRSFVTVPPQ